MIDQIITAITGTTILGGAYLVDLVIGIAKVIFTPELKWSWAKMLQDLAKAVLMAFGIVGFVAITSLVEWYGAKVGADLSVLSGISFPLLTGVIIGASAWYLSNALKNIRKFITQDNKIIDVHVDESKADYVGLSQTVTSKMQDAVNFISQVFTTKEVAETQKEIEEAGGRGVFYNVPTGSYQDFRNTVLGKGYDIDGAYGPQCWDGAALVWQQLGRLLSTGGTGAAKGCWTHARAVNAGNDFDLISDFNQLRIGDIIVYSAGTYGHIAFVDSVNPLRILGQNQTGTGTGAPFNVIPATSYGFLGAFRFKRWNVGKSQPVALNKTIEGNIDDLVQDTLRGKYGNGEARKVALGNRYEKVQARINQILKGDTKPQKQAEAFTVGDIVSPIKPISYDGVGLIQYDDSYKIIELSSDRAVLSARGQVWAALNIKNLRKA